MRFASLIALVAACSSVVLRDIFDNVSNYYIIILLEYQVYKVSSSRKKDAIVYQCGKKKPEVQQLDFELSHRNATMREIGV